MGILYKEPNEMTLIVNIKQIDNRVILEFEKDCGKHGTWETIDGYNLTARRLLQILQDREDYTDKELET